ncbi:MAG: T9SS type A sorting domain-containing protein [Flavobacteriales bacterium]|nr:T9SS type A sorting domain-containing protein [Flavobacteriales bacterium]
MRGEYWIDQDLGIGANIAFTIADAPEVPGIPLPISMAGYDPGTHIIGIRTLDADGHWSLTNFSSAVVIAEPATPPSDLAEIRYFLNEDPSFGNELVAWTGSAVNASGLSFNPDLTDAVAGINTLFIRSRTSDGHWGPTNHTSILVIEPDTSIGLIDRIETFALPAQDPGFGQADQHMVSSPENDLFVYEFDTPIPIDFMLGDTLMIRSRDTGGRWSLTNHVTVDGSTDVDELAGKTGITVYPNPFVETITVQPSEAKPLRVTLYDPAGKLVYDKMLMSATNIDLSGQASGAYTAFFWQEPERIHRTTLIKQ